MRLIFIRHGDPNYEKDNVTEKGKREVELLTERVCKWEAKHPITAFYTSPLGRAQATIAPSLEKLNRSQETLPWLQEFYYPAKDPETGNNHIMWDLKPEYFTKEKEYFDKDLWKDTDFIKSGDGARYYKMVCDGFDEILSRYGYKRDGMMYKVENPVKNPNWSNPIPKWHLVSEKKLQEDTTLVFTCHLGVMFAIISHLINLSPMQLWQGFFVAPTSITVLNSEERTEGSAYFRVERLGDTNHLTNGKEPISSSGYFSDVLNEI